MMKKKQTTTYWTISALLLVALSYLLFVSSMTLWMMFLWSGNSIVHVELPIMKEGNEFAVLLVDSALSAAFFLQHSGMIRRSFRRFLARSMHVNVEYHGAVYTFASSIVLLASVLFWQKSTVMVLDPNDMPMLFPFFVHALFVSALLGFYWSMNSLKAFDVCGVDPILYKLGTKDPPQSTMALSMAGPYGYARHPSYFCCLVLIWSCPSISLDRLLYNGLWSLWLVIGTLLEERDLVSDFGEPYKDYQRKVPMLIPWCVGSWPISAKKAKKSE